MTWLRSRMRTPVRALAWAAGSGEPLASVVGGPTSSPVTLSPPFVWSWMSSPSLRAERAVGLGEERVHGLVDGLTAELHVLVVAAERLLEDGVVARRDRLGRHLGLEDRLVLLED